jgi:hypothetical protein
VIQVLQGEVQVGQATRASLANISVQNDAEGIPAALQDFHWLGGRRPATPPLSIETEGPATFDDLVARPGSLRADVRGLVYRYRLAGTLPLETGARLDKGWITALVRHVSRNDSQLRIVVGARRIQIPPLGSEFPRVVLVNTSRKEVLLGTSRIQSSSSYTFGFARGYHRIGQEEALVFPEEGEENRMPLDDDWLAQAELAFLERELEGSFRTSVHIPDFRTHDTTFDPQDRSALVE